MTAKGGQGQSAVATELKQRGLGYAFKVNATAFRSVNARFGNRYRYFHFDLNAGCGINREARCIGSPLTFVEVMHAAGVDKYHASFCDIEKDQVQSLLRRPEMNDMCFVHHGDNRQHVLTIPETIKHYGESLRHAMGSVLCDPNGAQVPVEELSWLSAECPRIDVILHWNSTINKRLRNGIKPEERSLEEVLALMNKAHWLIREPTGVHQFTLLIGRNFQSGDYKSMGFYHLESQKGSDVLNRCDLTRKQYAQAVGFQGSLL